MRQIEAADVGIDVGSAPVVEVQTSERPWVFGRRWYWLLVGAWELAGTEAAVGAVVLLGYFLTKGRDSGAGSAWIRDARRHTQPGFGMHGGTQGVVGGSRLLVWERGLKVEADGSEGVQPVECKAHHIS